MSDELIIVLVFAFWALATLGAFALFALLFVGVVVFNVWVLVYNFRVGRDVLIYEWDSGEKILWLVLLFIIYPFGGWLYKTIRVPQRNAQLAALRKAQDPRVIHLPQR